MTSDSKDLRRSIRFPVAMARAIEAYAGSNDLRFSEAVRELCMRGLSAGFERELASHFSELVDASVDGAVARLENAFVYLADKMIYEMRNSEMRIIASSQGPFESEASD